MYRAPKPSFLSLALAVFFACTSSESSSSDSPEDPSSDNLVAYTGLTLIDGIDPNPKRNYTVVINPDTGDITDLFEGTQKSLAAHISVRDFSGKYMMPGLIEGHFHLCSTNGERTQEGLVSMQNMFRQGITTIRDMFGNGIGVRELQKMGAPKDQALPKVHFVCLVAGAYFISIDSRVEATVGRGTPGEEPWFKVIDDQTDVGELIQEARSFGCSGLKLYADISAANAKRLIAKGKEMNFPIFSHGALLEAGPRDLIGANSLSHADYLNFVTVDELPSLQEFDDPSYVESFPLEDLKSTRMRDFLTDFKAENMVLDATLNFYQRRAGPEERHILNFVQAASKEVYTQGAKISAGVDGFNDEISNPSNFSLLEEIKYLQQQTGMSNFEALQTATYNNALSLRIQDEYGSIAIGKKADLIVLEKNPLEDLEHLRSLEYVIKDGYEHKISDENKVQLRRRTAVTKAFHHCH